MFTISWVNRFNITTIFTCFIFKIMILWSILSHALDLAFRLPVLSTLNRWCGGVLGLLKGGLIVFILCWLLKGSYLPQDAIQNSYLLNLFCTVSPLAFFS